MSAIAGAIVLGVSLSDRVAAWDGVVLSESVSQSLAALGLAAAMALARHWRTGLAIGAVALMGLWSQARDTDGIFLGLLGVIGGAGLLLWRADRRWLVLAAAAVAWCIVGQASSGAGERWRFPFNNVLAQRILPDPVPREFFAGLGLPVTSALMEMSGQWASSNDWAFERDPALEPFREWAARRGRPTYALFLVSHPGYLWDGPWRDRAMLFAADISDYRPKGFWVDPGEWVGAHLVPRNDPRLMYLGTLLLIAAAVALRRRLPAEAFVVAAFMMAVAALSPIVWHGDAMEIRRHAMLVTVIWHLGLWLLIVLIVETFSLLRLPAS
jgi:hypothetical protein